MRVFLLFAGLLLLPLGGHCRCHSVIDDAGLLPGMQNIDVEYDWNPQVNFDSGLDIGLKMRF